MNPNFLPTHTRKPTSETVLHPKAFQSWRWVFLAAILMAAVAITTFYFSSAQAQTADGAIAGLTLSSTSAGELTVSWDAASPTPTDYRVDWAKSTEDYKSWKVDDGHVYLAETATTTTITDLSQDTEYKIRMRARYYKGEHMGKSWGGPWAEATITVAGEPAEPVQQPPKEDPTQQQTRDDPDPPAGTIDTLVATDDDTGQLVLTWEAPAAPNATPTDYHVSWAKSTEDYPADSADDGNAHPTTTTHTLPGLEFDTDYNIRVRARYTDGENAANPWNGPWTETTAQVKLPLPAAPFIGAAAATPDGDVNLVWFNLDEDDSITGYQILRGPDADNLVVIKDDTGPTSTSYIDATAPAGETHTYGVKARNASGLSPLSTITVTIPALEPEEEEELTTASHTSTDETLVSNLGQPGGDSAFVGPSPGSTNEISVSFTTGDNSFGYHLTSVQLYIRTALVADTNTPNPQASIRVDNGGTPSETVLSLLNTSTVITTDYQLTTFTKPDEVTIQLQPDTIYWLYISATGTAAGVEKTGSNNQDAESQADWRINDVRIERTDGGAWTTDVERDTLKMKILGHVTPPPTLVSNLGQTSGSDGSVAHNNRAAQAFIAGRSPTGFGYDFQGIKMFAKGSRSSSSTPILIPLVEASLYSNANGLPGRRLHRLTVPGNFASTTDFTEYTISAPQGTVLRTCLRSLK